MKRFTYLAAMVLLPLCTSMTYSQNRSSSNLDDLYQRLNGLYTVESSNYRVAMADSGISLVDKTTGEEIATISDEGEKGICIRGTLLTARRLPAASRESLKQRASLFNQSSSVGTMTLSETGAVTVHHRISHRGVSAVTVANIVVIFLDTIRRESREISASLAMQ